MNKIQIILDYAVDSLRLIATADENEILRLRMVFSDLIAILKPNAMKRPIVRELVDYIVDIRGY